MTDDKFRAIDLEKIPKDDKGNPAINLYIHLPTAGKFICYVIAGDELSDRKLHALKSHVDPRFFAVADQVADSTDDPVQGIRIDAYLENFKKVIAGEKIDLTGVKIETISKDTEKELRDLYRKILNNEAGSDTATTGRLAQMSDDILKVVAPEIKDIKTHLIKNTKYLHVMNDAASITAIAILFALANGFDSQKSYKELAYAALIMDLSLADLEEDQYNKYLVDPGSTPPEILQKIKQHPERSHQLASAKLKSLTDVTKQLILTHHELHNGKGYPRGIRNDGIFPVARILSLAVDVHEHIRRELLKTGKNIEIPDVLQTFVTTDIEPHLRRHNSRTVQTTLKFVLPDNLNGAENEQKA